MAKKQIRITAKVNGFRRCGIAHSSEPTLYDPGDFSRRQLDALEAELCLVVEHISVEETATDNRPAKVPDLKTATADQLIAHARVTQDPAWLQQLLNDKRVTVAGAATEALAALRGPGPAGTAGTRGPETGSRGPEVTPEQLIAELENLEDLERIQYLAADERKPVADAAAARLKALRAPKGGVAG